MKCYVNNVEYKLATGWSIGDKLGNPAPSTFVVCADNGQEAPKSGDVVTIVSDNENIIFYGLVAIPTSVPFSSPYQERIYSLKCTNANTILKRRVANISYANKSLEEIIEGLYGLYIQSENIGLVPLSGLDLPFFEVYNCKNMNLMSVMNELAGFANGAWRVNNEKTFEFIRYEDFPKVAQQVSINNAPFSDLKISDNASDMRTVQIIDGASITTDLQTEEYTVTEEWTGFSTIFPIVKQPSIYINNVEVSPDEIGVRGMQESETVRFFWGYDSNEVLLNPYYEGSTQVSVGDIIKIEYIGQTPIRYQITNDEKIEELAQRTGLSGIIDNVYTDPTIVTKQDAKTKAETLLSLYDERKTTVTAKTSIDKLIEAGYTLNDTELYREWKFNLPELGIVGDFVVAERYLSPFVLNDDESVMISLVLVDRDFAQGYGTMFSKLYNDITKLSVRADEVIIYDYPMEERLVLNEEVITDSAIPLWVSGTPMENGQIAQPLGTIMPNLVHGGGSSIWTPFTIYCASGDGQLVYPLGDAGVGYCCK